MDEFVSGGESYSPTSATQGYQSPMTYDDWIKSSDRTEVNKFLMGDNIFGKFANFFTGQKSVAEREYNKYVEEINKLNELAAINSARRYQEMREDSRYQRAVQDMKKAGLNPWLAVQGQGIAGAVGQTMSNSSAKGEEYSKKEKEKGAIASIIGILANILA